jgi:hypothetical protein
MIFSKKSINITFLILLSSILYNCAKVDPITGEKQVIEVDPLKKARNFSEKDGGILGGLTGGGKGGTFEFATSNVLWRATLKTLDFLPLTNADYSGGIIIYDWYSEKDDKDQIKISVRFLDNELRSTSVQILGHKKTCDNNGKCFTKKIDDKISEEIKSSIISAARLIKIEDSKKEKK